MENEQYLYFAVTKEQLEQVTSKRKSILNTDVYSVKVKKFHSCWLDSELEFSTEIFAESQSYVLLRSTVKWHDHNIKSLIMSSDCYCEIHYGLDRLVLTKYYTDKNLRDAFKDYCGLKILDDHEVKRYLYFVARKSILEELNYIAENGHFIYLRIGKNHEFEIGCKIINVNNEYDPYVMIRSMDNFQQKSIFLRNVIESLKNDDTVFGNNTVCRLYRSNFISCCDSNISKFIRYFTDEELPSIMAIYDFEEEDAEDSPIYSFNMNNSIEINLKDAFKVFKFKNLDNHDAKKHLYFLVRQSTLDKSVYKTKENHYKLRVGSNKEFVIGCEVININNETDPYVLLRSTSDFQNSICLKDAIKSFENDSTVIGNGYICKLYNNKHAIPGHLYYPNATAFIFYFTDEDLPSIMSDYDFEEKNNRITKENKDMPPYKHHINTGVPSIYLGCLEDCSGVYHGNIQEAKHVTVKDIKFNGPATIIFYADGSKEVVKCQKNDKNDKEKAIYMAMLKHKNKKLFSIINKALSSKDPEKALAYELIKYEGGDVKLLHQLCNNFIKVEKPKKKVKKQKQPKSKK